jgi:hypothetical protein
MPMVIKKGKGKTFAKEGQRIVESRSYKVLARITNF